MKITDGEQSPPWIEHDGSAVCPVPAGHDVEVRFRAGHTSRNDAPNAWLWSAYGVGSITHYRDWTAWEQSKMTKADDVPENPPAFACASDGGHQAGMALRDWFAGQVIEQCIRNALCDEGGWDADNVACHAYHMADAMLRARSVTLDSKGEG